jgi:thermitase
VLALRVLNASGSGTSSAVANAYDYAGDLGVAIVNASLGGPAMSQAERDAVAAHPGTLYVVAAGNDGVNNDVTPTYPCALAAANVICVGATDNADQPASFSNYGAATMDMFAPGVSIASTYGIGADLYVYMDGTSMATPHAAAVVALMRHSAPGLTAAQLKQALLAGAEPRGQLAGRSLTGARLNAAAAVQSALAPADAPPAPPPAPAAPEPDPGWDELPDDDTGDWTDVPSPPALSRLTRTRAIATLCRGTRPQCRPRPAVFHYRVDRPARVTAQVQRRTCSRGRCRLVTAASLATTARTGSNRLTIGAGGATARLAAGTYRLRVVATDRGEHSRPTLGAFRVRAA